METSEETIFDAFKRNIGEQLEPYLSEFNFPRDDSTITEGPKWINARFVRGEVSLVISLSMYETDTVDGMHVVLKTADSEKNLGEEAGSDFSGKFPVYFYTLDVIDSEFSRIMHDLKAHFEQDLKEAAEEPVSQPEPEDAEEVPTKEASDPEEEEPQAKEGYREKQPLAEEPQKNEPEAIRSAEPSKKKWWQKLLGK